MVIVDLDGRVVEGSLRPSSDLSDARGASIARSPPSAAWYTRTRAAPTAWAQACREIPCFGTTHADYFHGPVPVTAHAHAAEIEFEYEANTGVAIIRLMEGRDPLGCRRRWWPDTARSAGANRPATPRTWRRFWKKLAAMAWQTLAINPAAAPISEALRDKHYYRKHGPKAYYGQR